MKTIVLTILQFAGQAVCVLLFFYMMYFLWINTPPYDYPYTGIRWYYDPPVNQLSKP